MCREKFALQKGTDTVQYETGRKYFFIYVDTHFKKGSSQTSSQMNRFMIKEILVIRLTPDFCRTFETFFTKR
jgi:hypothetical protein